MSLFEDKYANKVVSDLIAVYKNEEEQVASHYDEIAIIQQLYTDLSLISSPAFSDVTKRFELISIASNCLRLAAMFHAKIEDADNDLKEAEEEEGLKVTEDANNGNYRLVMCTAWVDIPLEIATQVSLDTASEIGKNFAEDGGWVGFVDCIKWVFPRDITDLKIEEIKSRIKEKGSR